VDTGIASGNNKRSGYEKLWKTGEYPATGIVALEKRMITKDQFDDVFKHWKQAKEKGAEISFEEILVKKGMISSDKMMLLIPATIRKMNVEFGEIAVQKKIVSGSYIEKALRVQAEKYKAGELVLLSDLLIKAGLLSEMQRDDIYEIQNIRTHNWMISYGGGRRYGGATQNIRENEQFQHELTQGELAVTYQFISGEQLETGLKLLEQAYRKGLKISLERILLEKGFLDEQKAILLKETKLFLETRDLDSQFVLIAVQEGILTKENAKAIIAKQASRFEKVHKCVTAIEIAVEDHLMTQEQCNAILVKQKRAIPNGTDAIADEMDSKTVQDLEDDVRLNDDDSIEESDIGAEIIVNIGSDYLVAEIIIPALYPAVVTTADIRHLLQDRNIISGIIDDHAVDTYLSADTSGIRRFIVAHGRPPEPGADAELIVHFQREYLNPGKLTEDGKIDFKDRGAVPFVLKGDLLAQIIPEKPGKPGEDIYGDVIPAPLVNEVIVTAGTGAERSENGCKIFASEDGQPGMTVAGEISVFQDFKVDGDVDFNTGNIVFDGHITVKGSVKEGFSVIGGSLTTGAVDGGHIRLRGNLEVSSGIVDAEIRTEGNVQAVYVAGSIIEAYGDVIIKKEIIDSEVSTSGGCKSDGTTIVASTISALQGVEAAQIGTEVSDKCTIRVGVDFHTENEIKKYKAQIEALKSALETKQKEIEKNEREQSVINEMVSSTAYTMELAQARLKELELKLDNKVGDSNDETLIDDKKKLVGVVREAEMALDRYFAQQETLMAVAEKGRDECALLIGKIEKFNSAIREIKQWLKQQKKEAVVKVSKAIHQGTFISGPKASITLKESCRHSSVRELVGDPSKGENSWLMKIIPD